MLVREAEIRKIKGETECLSYSYESLINLQLTIDQDNQ